MRFSFSTFPPDFPRRAFLVVLSTVAAVGILVAGGHLYSPDEEVMARTARAIWTRGSLGIEPLSAAPDGDGFASRKGLDGRDYAQYGLGNPLFAGPLVLLGELATLIIPDKTAQNLLQFETISYLPTTETTGHALLRRFFLSFQGLLILLATTAVLFMTVFRLTNQVQKDCTTSSESPQPPPPLWVLPSILALSYALGTMALPHGRTFFSEPLAGLGILLGFYLAGFGPITPARCAAIGAAMALALLTRLDSLVMLPGIGLTLLWRYALENAGPKSLSSVQQFAQLVLATPAFLFRFILLLIGPSSVLVWQLTFNTLAFGGPFESAYADQTEGINFSTPWLIGAHGFLGSPGKSLFLFSPIILLALFGWRRLFHLYPALSWGLWLAIIAKVFLHATWQNWAGGWCWGPRHIMQVHVLLIIGLWGYLLPWTLVRRLLLVLFFTTSFFVQLFGSSQSFIDFYMLYYRTPFTPPQATVLYSPGEDGAMLQQLQILAPHPATGQLAPINPLALPAPLSDSIYVPQNTQWYRYGEMSRLGYTDNLWLRWIRRAQHRERPLQGLNNP